MKRAILPLVASGCAVLALVTVGGAAGSPATLTVTVAPKVPSRASPVGAVPAATAETATVVLHPRDGAALSRFIAAVTDKSSPLFHQYLGPAQYRARFGPAQSTLAAVDAQLRADGLRVTSVASDGLFIDVSGSAAQVEHAFGTRLERYRLRNGTIGQATTGAVRLPSSIARSVTAVVGLNSTVRPQPLQLLRAHTSGAHAAANAPHFKHPAGSPTACAAAKKAAKRRGGLTDDQIGNAYGAFGLYKAKDLGAGQHVAIYELEPFSAANVKKFDSCYFGAKAAAQMAKRLHVVRVDGGQPPGLGSGEAALDVEDISALAPRANIDVYEGKSPGANGLIYDPVDPYVSMVNNDVDRVISSSWGLCEQSVQGGQPGLQAAENLLFEQAAAQGQSMFSSAGDNGSDDCNTFYTPKPAKGQNPVSVDDPSSQPYVVSVGGTTIVRATQPAHEHVWNDGPHGGAGGGGISMSWKMPSWQRDSHVPGIVLPSSAAYTQANKVEKKFGYRRNFCQAYLSAATKATPCRTLPDVSAQADEYTGSITVYYGRGWTTFGGTSSSAPIWAAMLALVNASPTCHASAQTKGGVGFVSPLLYAVASKPAAYKASFNDITARNNDIYKLGHGKVFAAKPGYDLASGLGSPRLTSAGGKHGLAFYLCNNASSASRPVVTKLSPAVLPTGGGKVKITGMGFKSSSGPDVSSIQVGTWQIRGRKFKVNSNTSITATFPPAKDTAPAKAPKPQDGAGAAEVIVSLSNGKSSAPGPASTLQYVDKNGSSTVPAVTGMSPYGGSEKSPSPVTILGSGFTRARAVSFGGVKAKSFKVLSAYAIKATPPAYSSKTACAPLPKKGVYAGENARNDICQVQVTVSNAHGTSATGHILPPWEGAFKLNALGDQVAPRHCGCEIAPAPTEYDYAPTPSIRAVSIHKGAHGKTTVTIKGKGFNTLSIEWIDFGPASKGSSIDVNYLSVTGTKVHITAPRTKKRKKVPVSVRTLAGKSAPVTVTLP